ncbi:hypothetical protein ARMGADRAFT_1120591 [Armillaria gallica]|uniref:Uncharacterized protein n=1 Tax=Armillaria gallica TaxID=47427 RepID=A0A2H3CYQ4_ARMGA|nr:hypothetical protein ARMGADRAFT_1120591 [Armillaria gallica]
MDRKLHPNLKLERGLILVHLIIIIGGYSAGGQMAQHYAILRTSTDDDDRLHFWIGNSSLLSGVDVLKYGLESNFPAYVSKNAHTLGREGIIKRYHSWMLNYAWGLTQGQNHLERGWNFIMMLEDMGGIPKLTTVDWVPGVSHNSEAVPVLKSSYGSNTIHVQCSV